MTIRRERFRPRLRVVPTAALSPSELSSVRALMDEAFGDDEDERFGDDDWEHALGGLHVVLDLEDDVLSHASIVERTLELDGRPLRTGYVEAVATAPGMQGLGFGSTVMETVTARIRSDFELGALGTGRHSFYERLGWETWRGEAFVRDRDGELRRTPDEDGFILVLRTSSSPPFEGTEALACDWRAGDVW